MDKRQSLKEAIERFGKNITNLFAELPAEQPKEGELKVSAVEIGGKVEMVDAEGNLQPIADGEYTYGDDVLTVKDGLIEAINGEKGEDKPVEEQPAEEMAEEPAQEEPKPSEDVESMKAEIEALKAQIDEIKALVQSKNEQEQEMAAQFANQVKELNETIKTLASIPVEFSKTNKNNIVKDDKEDKLLQAASFWKRK